MKSTKQYIKEFDEKRYPKYKGHLYYGWEVEEIIKSVKIDAKTEYESLLNLMTGI